MQNIRIGGRLARTQYQYTLQDVDIDELNTWAPKMLAKLRTLPGLQDVATDQATGADPALFDHLPYDGLSIGFDLSVPDHSVSQVKSSADDAGRAAPEPQCRLRPGATLSPPGTIRWSRHIRGEKPRWNQPRRQMRIIP